MKSEDKAMYDKWTKKELILEIENLKRTKKYGLVWETNDEDVVKELRDNYPYLEEDISKQILTDSNKPTNLIIEGDNYHSLSVLNYTHSEKIDVIYIDPPYNTGARDWKYNNDYVDSDDSFRHSKWINMMHQRLSIAKNLLTKQGVLICAIDENELANLKLLLEIIFKKNIYEIHIVTVIHNPRGIQGKNFSYVNEFLIFVIPKGYKSINYTTVEDKDIDWSQFRNWGHESLRTDAKNCFYSINIRDDQIISFGKVLDKNIHPKQNIINPDGSISVFPVDNKGIERKWRYSRHSVIDIKDQLRTKKINDKWVIEIGKNQAIKKTLWQSRFYDSSTYGTQILSNLIGKGKFDYPKSLYAVKECINAVIHDKDNAIILDFFAGSGTTGHAVLELNKEDGGNRQFILCTNNENNIAEEVTYQRVKKNIEGYTGINDKKKYKGLGGNLRYFKTNLFPFENTVLESLVVNEK